MNKNVWVVMEQVYNVITFERVHDDRIVCVCADEKTARKNTPNDWEDAERAEKHEFWTICTDFIEES